MAQPITVDFILATIEEFVGDNVGLKKQVQELSTQINKRDADMRDLVTKYTQAAEENGKLKQQTEFAIKRNKELEAVFNGNVTVQELTAQVNYLTQLNAELKQKNNELFTLASSKTTPAPPDDGLANLYAKLTDLGGQLQEIKNVPKTSDTGLVNLYSGIHAKLTDLGGQLQEIKNVPKPPPPPVQQPIPVPVPIYVPPPPPAPLPVYVPPPPPPPLPVPQTNIKPNTRSSGRGRVNGSVVPLGRTVVPNVAKPPVYVTVSKPIKPAAVQHKTYISSMTRRH